MSFYEKVPTDIRKSSSKNQGNTSYLPIVQQHTKPTNTTGCIRTLLSELKWDSAGVRKFGYSQFKSGCTGVRGKPSSSTEVKN